MPRSAPSPPTCETLSSGGGGLSRRKFLGKCASVAVPLALSNLIVGPALTDLRRKPNILFIMADDLGYECLGVNGSTSYKTPNLDRLARTGLRFTSAYSTPKCTPSRVQVMTGQYPFRNGWTENIGERPYKDQKLDPSLTNFAHVLKSAGYMTAVAGKWQLARFDDYPSHATACGFDEYCLFTSRFGNRKNSRYWAPSVWRNGALVQEILKPKSRVFGPEFFTDFLIDFITKNTNQPFLAYYPMVLVHRPWVQTPDNKGRSGMKKKDPRLFAGFVEYMDELVGRLLSALDDLQLRQNTLIVFTADNATTKGVISKLGGVEIRGGKGTMTDAGTHVPLIANWLGTAPSGKIYDDLVDLSDILPTFAEAAGVAIPANHIVDGRSFLPQIRGDNGNPRDWVFIQFGNKRAVRSFTWKLHNNGNFFNLIADPFENTPIKASNDTPESAAARERLKIALDLNCKPFEILGFRRCLDVRSWL